MASIILRGAQRVDTIDVQDRGLNYGDGVFENILIHQSQPVWWNEHWQRLLKGLDRLTISAPDHDFIRQQADNLIKQSERYDAVLKIVVTRGSAGRGYAPSKDAEPTIMLSLHVAPVASSKDGIHIRWCNTQLSSQPLLAGIKHLNRLEQVLARAEWDDPQITDGLMCDQQGRVVCATAANAFFLIDGQWQTPKITHCGIEGIARAWLLEHLPNVVETEIKIPDVAGAETMFLCNAVRGVMPVLSVDQQHFSQMAPAYRVRELLANAIPAFAR
jgi:4-amino-4-deoxychorismate lyase